MVALDKLIGLVSPLVGLMLGRATFGWATVSRATGQLSIGENSAHQKTLGFNTAVLVALPYSGGAGRTLLANIRLG